MNSFLRTTGLPVLLSASLLALVGCNSSDDDPLPPPPPDPEPVAKIFQVEVVNLTNNQPLSPLAVVLHNEGELWQLNQSASEALENLAESGDGSDILNLSVVIASAAGSAPVGPGASDSLTVETLNENTLYLSMATMLVNTNDAFTGFSRIDVTNMAVGDSLTQRAAAYDAGTEANSEMAGTIPGPADGGEGFNAARDDVDFVSRHAGVVSVDDGLNVSTLLESHRFDNPVLAFTITRMQ